MTIHRANVREMRTGICKRLNKARHSNEVTVIFSDGVPHAAIVPIDAVPELRRQIEATPETAPQAPEAASTGK